MMGGFFDELRRKAALAAKAMTTFCNVAPNAIPRTHCDDLYGLTDRGEAVMKRAKQEAQRFNHEYIATEHILLALLKEGSGVPATILKNLGADWRKIRLEVEKTVQFKSGVVPIGKLPLLPRAKLVVEYAKEEARNLNHNYIGTEHLLLGLIREEEGVAALVLHRQRLSLDAVRGEIMKVLGQV